MVKDLAFLGFLAAVPCTTTPCMALQIYPLVDQQRSVATISKDQQNRIAVQGDRIQQIFGTDGVFDVQSDEEGGQIFLKLLYIGSSKAVTVTIVTESGLTQDLKLIAKDIESQSILLKPRLQQGPRPRRQSHDSGI